MPRELVVIGTSLGGLAALEILLPGLPEGLPLAIVIVQHRLAQSDQTLSLLLQLRCALPVCEPDDKEPIIPGRVYLAPPDYHLLIGRGRFALSTEPRVCYARPSIDVLFESAAHMYGAGVIGVVLTGASRDGADGLASIKARGGLTIAQSPSTAESAVLPQAAIDAVDVDAILPLEEIGACVI
jgi:two-component system chemotaxis response regulator CheB